ncbi:MAG: Tyrosine recombinase XerC [Paracidovorax wautersii]|uniref:Tyrosine recombinase XerC n=1 Tax=Paracidovorax wautersii TaxID=1177982 RepID=A0A7V8JQV8_9BURK|nr:MAG: Tyrosine recombinase XerC [Paracidovorax wautersii]
MATPIKTAAGTWRVQIKVGETRDAATFPTKREAIEWAEARRLELRQERGGKAAGKGAGKTLKDAVDRYMEEITSTKRGENFENTRLLAFLRDPLFPSKKLIGDVGTDDMARWRDGRQAKVKPGTVLREITIMTHLFDVARREWRWISANPMDDMRRPSKPAHRERVISGPEIRRMLRVMGWSRHKPVRSAGQAVAACFLGALQTGMRAGELCGLEWSDVRANYCVLHDGKTKTGKGRHVPLTPAALRNLESMRGWDDATVMGIQTKSLDALFRKYRERAGLSGFTFHDTRHTAATRMAQRLHVLDLCKVFGWTNTARALTYYNPSAADIAARLTGGDAAPIRRSR